MPSRRENGWSQTPPWRGAGDPLFRQIARLAVAPRTVAWVELFVRDDLLEKPGGEGRTLVSVVSCRGAASGPPPKGDGAPVPLPRWLARLASATARRERAAGGLGTAVVFAIRIEGVPFGLLRLHGEVPTGQALNEWVALAERIELWLERDLLTHRLGEARARHRTVLEAAGDGILIVDARTSLIVEVNPRAATLSRYRETDLVGRLLWTLLSDAEGADLRGFPARTHATRPILRLLRRRGEPLPVAVTVSRVPGPSPLLHLILSDVSTEEQARRELAQAKETLCAIAVAAVYLQSPVDRAEVFEVVGRELAGLGYLSAVLLPTRDLPLPAAPATKPATRWEVAHLRGAAGGTEPPADLLGSRFEPERLAPLRRALSSGRPSFSDDPADDLRALWPGLRASAATTLTARLDIRGLFIAPMGREVAKAGALLVAGRSLRAVDAEGIDAFARQAGMALERASLYSELRQRSASLELEVDRRTRELTLAIRALREIDRRKDNFLANVSHELRTPLVTILGYTQLILGGRTGTLTDQQRACLETSHRNAQRLKGFIEELLDFSHHELTSQSLRPTGFELRVAIEQATAALYPRLLERGLTLRSRIARGTPPAFGERERIVQVLSNLLSNAERHCQPGGRLRVAVAQVRGRIRVSVADNGTGIPPEHRARIFERLYQVEDRAIAREKGAGLGLGLAIAKSIIEAHGGKIWIDVRPSQGSRFHFELPSAEQVAGAPTLRP